MIWTDIVRLSGGPSPVGGLVDTGRAIPASPITPKLPCQSPLSPSKSPLNQRLIDPFGGLASNGRACCNGIMAISHPSPALLDRLAQRLGPRGFATDVETI